MKHYVLISLLALSFSVKTQDVIYLELEPAELTSTEKIYNFIVHDFENMVGWQFSMLFDSSKMQFKEIRNALLDDLTTHSFNEPIPGVLLTVWLDKDLESTDYIEPTVVFQIVFELFDPEGSPVCMSESPLSYEFIIKEGLGLPDLTEALINDDCHDDFSVFFNTTGSGDLSTVKNELLDQLNLTNEGALSFSTTEDLEMSMVVYDIMGRTITSQQEEIYFAGRNSVNIGKHLSDGIYLLQIDTAGGYSASFLVFTQ